MCRTRTTYANKTTMFQYATLLAKTHLKAGEVSVGEMIQKCDTTLALFWRSACTPPLCKHEHHFSRTQEVNK